MNTPINESREIEEFARLINSASEDEELFLFIAFCFERLKKGDTVPVIWHDYLATILDT